MPTRKTRFPQLSPQRIEKFFIYDLSGGYNDSTNQATLADTEFSDGLNVEITDNRVVTGRGGTVMKGQYLGPTTKILGAFDYLKPTSGARKQLVVYDTDIFLFSSSEWTPQSQSLTTNKEAEFCIGNDKVYFTNNYDAVRNYDGSSWTAMADFPVAGASSSQRGTGLCYFKDRLIAWNTTEKPNRVYYSNAGLETIGANNYFDLVEPVIVCVPFFNYLLVFTESSIYRIGDFVFTGTTYDPDNLQPLPTNLGCVSRRTAKQVGDWVVYLSRKGLCRTNGNFTELVSQNKVDGFIDSLSTSYITKACAGVYNKRYVFSVSTTGSENNKVMFYDPKNNVFYPPITGLNISVFSTWIESNGETLYAGDDTEGRMIQLDQTGIYDEDYKTKYDTGKDADNQIIAASTVRKAQSFQLDDDTVITKVAAYMRYNSGTQTGLTVRIETNNSGVPSGTLVDSNATGTIASFSHTDYRYKTVTFSTPFELSGDTTYWLVVQHTTEGSGNSNYYWGSDDSSPTYTTGSLASYSSSSWTADANKDLLFRVEGKTAYSKYFTSKGYFLGDPQYMKKLKKMFIELDASGNWDVLIGFNTDLYSGFNDYLVNLSGNAPVRGSTLTRGYFTRGTQSKVKQFLNLSSLKGRMIKFRIKNDDIGENFVFYGAQLNYIIRTLLR